MLSQTKDAAEYRTLRAQLTGPLRTMGAKPIESNAPAWWHGDEEAYETATSAMMGLPSRR